MKLDRLDFDEYDCNNMNHKCLIAILNNDTLVRRTFFSMSDYISTIIDHVDRQELDRVYIVSLLGNTIGVIMSKKYEDKLEISYALSPDYRGKDLATYMLEQYCNYLFKEYNVDKLYLQINPMNKGSKIVASRVGFIKESYSRYVINNYLK
jgi:RimJ/RimL family protein N-acetyltransferase